MVYDFGPQIRKLRLARHWTQKYLGQKINLSSSAISNYENEAQIPPITVAVSLSDIFGVSLDTLVYGSDPTSIATRNLAPDEISLLDAIRIEMLSPSHRGAELSAEQL